MQSRPSSRLHEHTRSSVPEIFGIYPSIRILSFCSNKSTQTRTVPVWRIRQKTLLYVERVAGHLGTFPNCHFPPRICRLRIHCNICTIPKKKNTHAVFNDFGIFFFNDSNTLLKYSPMPTRKLHGIVKDLTALDALITIVQFSTYEFDITHKIRHVCKNQNSRDDVGWTGASARRRDSLRTLSRVNYIYKYDDKRRKTQNRT